MIFSVTVSDTASKRSLLNIHNTCDCEVFVTMIYISLQEKDTLVKGVLYFSKTSLELIFSDLRHQAMGFARNVYVLRIKT